MAVQSILHHSPEGGNQVGSDSGGAAYPMRMGLEIGHNNVLFIRAPQPNQLEYIIDFGFVTLDTVDLYIAPDKIEVFGFYGGGINSGGRSVLQGGYRSFHQPAREGFDVSGNGGFVEIQQIRGGVGVGAGDHNGIHRDARCLADLQPGIVYHFGIGVGQIHSEDQNGIIVAVRQGNACGIQRILNLGGHTAGGVAIAPQRNGLSGGDVHSAEAYGKIRGECFLQFSDRKGEVFMITDCTGLVGQYQIHIVFAGVPDGGDIYRIF